MAHRGAGRTDRAYGGASDIAIERWVANVMDRRMIPHDVASARLDALAELRCKGVMPVTPRSCRRWCHRGDGRAAVRCRSAAAVSGRVDLVPNRLDRRLVVLVSDARLPIDGRH